MNKKKNTLDDGYQLGDKLVNEWNSQPDPQKVYIDGYRIHHGLVGLGCTVLGLVGLGASAISDNKKTKTSASDLSGFAIGLGIRLMEDDIDDAPDWFNFEKNNSNQSQYQTNYDGFA